jgi:hypothetical protein
MMILIFLLNCILFIKSFELIDHVSKTTYKDIHPLFHPFEIPNQSLKVSSTINNDFIYLSLHDDKYYENVTWTIMINIINEDKCLNLTIDQINENLIKDNCTLYSSLFLAKHKLLKIGCPVYYGNVFLQPIKDGCKKTVKVRKNYIEKDLIDLIKTPNLNYTFSLLKPCYGEENIIIEKNLYYTKPKSYETTVKNVLSNYYYNKNQYYDTTNFTKIVNYPVSETWKELYKNKAVQNNSPWGLDRIDQRFGLDLTYTYNNGGSDITALIIDTGILATHNEFGGRAEFVINTSGDNVNTDSNGHGYNYFYLRIHLVSHSGFFSINFSKYWLGSVKLISISL